MATVEFYEAGYADNPKVGADSNTLPLRSADYQHNRALDNQIYTTQSASRLRQLVIPGLLHW